MSTPNGSGPNLPGNDGSWFLRAVGIEAPPETLDDVEAQNTTEAVSQLWKAGEADALTDWAPEELSKTAEKERSFRWPVVITVAVLVAAVAALLLWLPRTSEGRADDLAVAYGAALGEIRNDLPAAQQVLAVVTDPAEDASQFPELIPVIADLRADADGALELASEPMPSAWPLASDEPFDELRPFRDQTSAEAITAQAIARRLGDVLDYRSLFSGFMVVGDLPTTSNDLNELNTRLATAAADSALILTELPEVAAFADHRAAAQDLVDRFLTWQVDYVDALRTGDTATVTILLAEYTLLRTELDELMLDALTQLRVEIDAQIIQLAGDIDATMAGLAGT